MRTERLDGRDYLIAPVTLINPGILNGSRGPLLYLLEDMKKTVNAWNGMPLLLNHPKTKSGRNPKVWQESGLGYIYNAEVNGKLQAEAWFDVEKTNRVDHRIVPTVKAGKKVEVSTGLNIVPEEKTGVTENGDEYVGIARGHQPDHLAVLPDSIGACSVTDGCGINNETDSEENPMKLTKKQRAEIIDDLVENCSCWEESERETLNESDDKQLNLFNVAMKKSQEVDEKEAEILAAKKKLKEKEAVANAAKEGFKVGNDHFTLNEEGEWIRKKGETKKVNNEEKQPITMEDLPEEIRNAAAYGLARQEEDRVELIDRLVANIDESKQEEKRTFFSKFALEDLQELADDLPKQTENTELSVQSFRGQNVGNTSPKKIDAKPAPLGQPTWNFEQKAS